MEPPPAADGLVLRPEELRDHAAVRAVHLRAFGDHGRKVADLVDALRSGFDRDRIRSVVAQRDGGVVGHVMLTPSLLDAPRRLVEVPVLSPLCVVPELHSRGVGSTLVRRAVAVATAELEAPLMFLEGAPGYYGRFGFEPGEEHGFRRPSLRIPPAAFQVLRLPTYEPWMTGTLVYSRVFWDHDAVGLRDWA